ncbi:hypothetical protein [Pseudonocardia sp. P1]|uniref:hypothetical protein n=1 Tax=Pseudonocardia sp. P1 TaxID=761194 RepID=UPI00307D4182
MPHAEFARLRREAPVAWVEEPAYEGFAGGPGFWAVTRHRDVITVSKHPEIFSSHAGATFLRDQSPRDLAALQQMMLNIDPPDHSKLRKIVSKVFTPKMVNGMFDSVDRYAAQIVDDLEPGTEVDLVEKVSSEMPLLVLAELLGVPPRIATCSTAGPTAWWASTIPPTVAGPRSSRLHGDVRLRREADRDPPGEPRRRRLEP